MAEKDYIIDEVAAEFRVHRKTVERWIARGDLDAYRFGRHYRITRAAITKFKHTHKVQPEIQVEGEPELSRVG